MDLKRIFIKNSRPSYKEKQMVDAISRAIEEKLEKDPNILKNFQPAKNFDELKKLYETYCIDDVDFQNVGDDNTTGSGAGEPNKPDAETKTDIDLETDDIPEFVDPMNRENPIVREYVMKGDFKGDKPMETQEQVINEPNSFQEAFEFPDEFTMDEQPAAGNSGASSGNQTNQQNRQTNTGKNAQQKPIRPINPDFDEMSAGKKKRSTRKFAKYIVEAAAMLQAKAFVYLTTKDINAVKLTEYSLNNEIDLDMQISLNEEQVTTVRDFFASQCIAAEEMSKIDQEKLNDLADSLAEVMLEKGVAPTPQQELMLIGFSILGEQVIKAAVFSSQNKAILQQLKDINAKTNPKSSTAPPPPKPEPKKEAPKSPPPAQEEAPKRTPHYETVIDNNMSEVDRKIKEEQDALGKGNLQRNDVFEDLLEENKIAETE